MKDKILMIVFILVLGSVLTAALVAVNFYTTPVIEKNEEIATKSSILKALNISFGQDNVEEIFAENVEEKQQDGTTYYLAKDSNIAFPYSGPGLWGPIEGIIAVQPGRSGRDNQIDSITGATMTSNAFIAILNNNLQEVMPAVKRGESR